jgi:transposase, IS5 family
MLLKITTSSRATALLMEDMPVGHAQEAGIANIVFNKVVGSMQNIAGSSNMETRLKKWRSTMEAIISNIKRGFNIFTCNWKGWIHFRAKVFWSILAYNFRVMTGLILAWIKPVTKVC